MKITRAVVPSLFTTLNIFCGFRAIIYTHQSDFVMAAWFIILAAIFDSLDGVMARITKSSSQFGVELDSLADAISFGAAPSFLAYNVFLYNYGNIGIAIASLPVILGAIRLARFNVQLVGFDKNYFNGMPIPLQAITMCAYIIQYHNKIEFDGAIFTFVVITLSFLMVSTIKYDTLPKISKKQIKLHPLKYSVILIAVCLIIISSGSFLFPLLSIYIVFGIFRSIYNWLKKNFSKTENNPEPAGEFSSIDI